MSGVYAPGTLPYPFRTPGERTGRVAMATEGLGTFCWFELATTNAAKALDFYRGLFGWEAQTTPLPGGGTYTLLSTKGVGVGAAYDMSPAMGGNLPPHWN